MRQLISHSVLLALLTVTAGAQADPEMRCRLDGAYIKVYGKDEAEQRAVCERQGGEYTQYVQQQQSHGPDPRSKAMNSIMGH
ncbi:MAG: hypothetical protein HYX63_04260 [Gammaproteobacteria bacterium]|nr:hypothetical protein [Gammaproteobacteria bacterium]